jgi:hypothetical protein
MSRRQLAPFADADREVLEYAADVALATGEVVTVLRLGLALVPDTVVLEGLANGVTVPSTWRLARDGRTVSLYRLPAELFEDDR